MQARQGEDGPNTHAIRQGRVRMLPGERGGVEFRVVLPYTILNDLVQRELIDGEQEAAARYYQALREAFEAGFFAHRGSPGESKARTMSDDYLYIRRRVQVKHLRIIDQACFTQWTPLSSFDLESVVHAFHRLVEIRREIFELHREEHERDGAGSR